MTHEGFQNPPLFEAFMHYAGMAIEITGVLVIILGAVLAGLFYLRSLLRKDGADLAYEGLRTNLGRAILLGLEFLVAADIVGTVAVEPSWENIGILAAIVLIRTFLSFALEREVQARDTPNPQR